MLLAPLQYAISDPAAKKLIVLHTFGNHWNYSYRHPQSSDRWKPSLFGIDKPAYTSLKLKAEKAAAAGKITAVGYAQSWPVQSACCSGSGDKRPKRFS